MKDYNKNITPGATFAVHTGTYAGELLLNIKSTPIDCYFLAIPTMVNRIIPRAIVEHALKTNIIKFVEKVPNYVLKVSIEQYKKNENTINRREQSNTQNFLDSKDAK